MSDHLTCIAIMSSDECKPKKCRQKCKMSCPIVITASLRKEQSYTGSSGSSSDPIAPTIDPDQPPAPTVAKLKKPKSAVAKLRVPAAPL
ncbi:hypothetical protein FF2_045779 [Malus domestica]